MVFVVFLLFWQQARKSPAAQRRVRSREFLLAGMLLAVGVAVAAWLSAPVEQRLFGGDLTLWLSRRLGMVYDQRNSILIAFGVGFMVIPIIFTLAEDALSSVPHSMTAASMALGASRWQTLWRVVLPSASPGIFAAVMIGFGRAVGETMVVPDGHRQYGADRLEPLQRHADPLGQHRRRNSPKRRSAARSTAFCSSARWCCS